MTKYTGSPIVTAIVSLMLVLPIPIVLSTPIALADVKTSEHGGDSKCYNCHVDDYPITSQEDDLHGMTAAIAWKNCGVSGCHGVLNSSLEMSVHAQIDCRGCHSPLHVSFNQAGAGAWMFVNRVNTSDTPAYKPETPIEWNREVFFYDSTNDTSQLGSNIGTWGGEIHWAWTNISGTASGISTGSRYLVCFNCHFITVNPAEAGLTRMIQGKSMIAVPEFSLRLSPHDITESALKEAASETTHLVALKSDSIRTASGIIAGIGIVGLVLWRKRTYSI